MKVEKILHFWIAHNESIIQWLVVGILGLMALWLIQFLFDKPKPEASAGAAVNLDSIEEKLKKILEQSSTMTAATGGVVTDPTLKGELEKREKEIQELKTQLAGASKGSDPAPYLSKIGELESKLAEYEILEDDIADLSLFKEENARLKMELEKLKGSVPGALQTETPPPADDPVPEPAKENLVAEFQAAVQQEKAAPVPAAAQIPEPEPEPEPVAAAPPPPPAPVTAAAEDILAEFSAELPDMGNDLNTEKMLAEMDALNSVGAADTSALEEESDISKMAEEANKLSNNG